MTSGGGSTDKVVILDKLDTKRVSGSALEKYKKKVQQCSTGAIKAEKIWNQSFGIVNDDGKLDVSQKLSQNIYYHVAEVSSENLLGDQVNKPLVYTPRTALNYNLPISLPSGPNTGVMLISYLLKIFTASS